MAEHNNKNKTRERKTIGKKSKLHKRTTKEKNRARSDEKKEHYEKKRGVSASDNRGPKNARPGVGRDGAKGRAAPKKKKPQLDFMDRLPERSTRKQLIDTLKFDRDGLVTVVAQDHWNNEVLMIAHANREALDLSLQSGFMHYYSRSRKKLWKKGEDSGHRQKVISFQVDCDGDAILAKVKQTKAACHLGFRSCFAYLIQKSGRIRVVGKMMFNPNKVYRK